MIMPPSAPTHSCSGLRISPVSEVYVSPRPAAVSACVPCKGRYSRWACIVSGMGCTQTFDMRWHDLYVDKGFVSNGLHPGELRGFYC